MSGKHTGPVRPVTMPIEGDPSMLQRLGIMALVVVTAAACVGLGVLIGMWVWA